MLLTVFIAGVLSFNIVSNAMVAVYRSPYARVTSEPRQSVLYLLKSSVGFVALIAFFFLLYRFFQLFEWWIPLVVLAGSAFVGAPILVIIVGASNHYRVATIYHLFVVVITIFVWLGDLSRFA